MTGKYYPVDEEAAKRAQAMCEFQRVYDRNKNKGVPASCR